MDPGYSIGRRMMCVQELWQFANVSALMVGLSFVMKDRSAAAQQNDHQWMATLPIQQGPELWERDLLEYPENLSVSLA